MRLWINGGTLVLTHVRKTFRDNQAIHFGGTPPWKPRNHSKSSIDIDEMMVMVGVIPAVGFQRFSGGFFSWFSQIDGDSMEVDCGWEEVTMSFRNAWDLEIWSLTHGDFIHERLGWHDSIFENVWDDGIWSWKMIHKGGVTCHWYFSFTLSRETSDIQSRPFFGKILRYKLGTRW